MRMYAAIIDAASFLRFGIVGAVGFLVDAGMLQLLLVLGWGLVEARVVAIPVAVLATWALNRRFTFPEAQAGPALASLVKYMGVSAVGAAMNFLAYSALVLSSSTLAGHPMAALAIGSIVAMLVNYLGSRHFAFRT